jgi:hypothetical protein
MGAGVVCFHLGTPLLLGLLIAGCGSGASDETPGSRGPATEGRAGTPWFAEEAQRRGLVFAHESGHREGTYYMPEIMGGGAALFDMDDDGDLDAYLVQSGRIDGAPSAGNRLFENTGAGSFRDVTEGSGAGDRGYGNGVACADVDEDGDVDLYVTNTGPNVLLLNEGGGRFRDATAEAGVGDPGWGTSAAFLDADGDGLLDLFVTNYLDWSVATELPCMDALSRPDYCSPKNYRTPARDVFYRNLGGGRFEDLSEASGVAAEPGNGLGLGCADFDGDGNVDVFVANDGMADHLWLGDGAGNFVNRAYAWGCATDLNGLKKAGMGVAVADVDDDLDVDLLVCNLDRESDSMFLNEGTYFADGTARMGLASVSKAFTRFGMGWIDLDLDGRLDLFQANGRVQRARTAVAGDPYAEENLVFRGTAGGRFEEVRPRGGTGEELSATSRAAAFGDVDGDGGIDVLVVNRDGPAHLLMNRVEGRGAWIVLDARERSGRPAIGATLTVTVGERTLRRDVRAAYSYQASNDPRVHLGLGRADGIASVGVRWADGAEHAFGPLAAGGVHRLVRPD